MDTNKAPDLEVVGINKDFPGVKALSEVSITVKSGTVHALLGENGAGKSTLMNILAGFIRADSGTVRIDGKDVEIDDPLAAQALGIGMVPQELSLVPALTVMENIRLGSFPGKWGGLFIDWKRTGAAAAEVLRRLDGGIDVRSRVRDLTTAHQQLVQIARAIAFGARILILDEPTACLTEMETRRLFDIIADFKGTGGSVIYISHRLEEIKKICDRATILRDGRKIIDLDTGATTVPEIIRHMVGRDLSPASAPSARPASKGGDAVLRVQGYSRDNEFQDISFELREGEILGFAGLIGSGRTELMQAIIGDKKADAGRVFLKDRNGMVGECAFRHPGEALAHGVAYVPEERRNMALFPGLSVQKNMTISILRSLHRHVLGLDFKREKRCSERYVRDFGIKTPGLKVLVENLSGGNQQKAVIARFLLTECRILILDEPTRGIDVHAKREIYDILRGLIAKGGISVILISSEMQELLENADRVLVMHEGAIKGEVEVTKDTRQEEIMRLALH